MQRDKINSNVAYAMQNRVDHFNNDNRKCISNVPNPSVVHVFGPGPHFPHVRSPTPTHTHTRTHACSHARTHAHTHTHTHARTHPHTCTKDLAGSRGTILFPLPLVPASLNVPLLLLTHSQTDHGIAGDNSVTAAYPRSQAANSEVRNCRNCQSEPFAPQKLTTI